MRKSVTACAPRAASTVPDSGTLPFLDDIFDAGCLAEARKTLTYQIQGLQVPFDSLARIGRETFLVALIASHRTEWEDGSLPVDSLLFMDLHGRFYGIEEQVGPDRLTNPKVLARLPDGKQAMKWAAKHLIANAPMCSQFVKAIENPAFEFMPMIPEGPKRRKRRTAKKTAPRPLAVQMEMAPALVAMIQDLDRDPRAETLAEARRNVSALHRELYSEETFKAVANG